MFSTISKNSTKFLFVPPHWCVFPLLHFWYCQFVAKVILIYFSLLVMKTRRAKLKKRVGQGYKKNRRRQGVGLISRTYALRFSPRPIWLNVVRSEANRKQIFEGCKPQSLINYFNVYFFMVCTRLKI